VLKPSGVFLNKLKCRPGRPTNLYLLAQNAFYSGSQILLYVHPWKCFLFSPNLWIRKGACTTLVTFILFPCFATTAVSQLYCVLLKYAFSRIHSGFSVPARALIFACYSFSIFILCPRLCFNGPELLKSFGTFYRRLFPHGLLILCFDLGLLPFGGPI